MQKECKVFSSIIYIIAKQNETEKKRNIYVEKRENYVQRNNFYLPDIYHETFNISRDGNNKIEL